MSLAPDNNSQTLDEYLVQAGEVDEQPSFTYKLDFETGRIGGMVDEIDAMRQFIQKALITTRSEYLIYTDDYGCELPGMIGQAVTDGFLHSEIPRMVREALIYDDRITGVNQITARREGAAVFIVCTVLTIYGEFTEEVVI
jgi:phage baseplate assembly protein W